jgi:hypothetical protein
MGAILNAAIPPSQLMGPSSATGSTSQVQEPANVKQPMFTPTMSQRAGQAPQTTGGPAGGANDLMSLLKTFFGQGGANPLAGIMGGMGQPQNAGQAALQAVRGGGQFSPGSSIIQPGRQSWAAQPINAAAPYQSAIQNHNDYAQNIKNVTAQVPKPTAPSNPIGQTQKPGAQNQEVQRAQVQPAKQPVYSQPQRNQPMMSYVANAPGPFSGNRQIMTNPSVRPQEPVASTNPFAKKPLIRNTPSMSAGYGIQSAPQRPSQAPSNPTGQMQKPGAQRR